MQQSVKIGDQVYAREGGTMFGAVRSVTVHGLTVYVENAGDFQVRSEAIRTVHDGKVILDVERLEAGLRDAIIRAHDKEQAHT